MLGIPLFVIALVAYACTGTSNTPTNNAGANGGVPGSSPTGVITPAPSETISGPPGHIYPTGNGPSGSVGGSGSSGGANGSSGGNGGSGSTGAAGIGGVGSGSGGGTGGGNGTGGSGQGGAGGDASGCALTLSISLDRTSNSGPVHYPAGSYPTFKITADDAGSANCTLDVSGKGMLVSVMPLGTTTPVWTSATCSGGSDLRVLGPGDAQTFQVPWKRWQSQGNTCPVSKLPTVSSGTYTVNVEANGVTTSQVEFVLD